MTKQQFLESLQKMEKDITKAVNKSAEQTEYHSRETLVNAITDIQLRILELQRQIKTY